MDKPPVSEIIAEEAAVIAEEGNLTYNKEERRNAIQDKSIIIHMSEVQSVYLVCGRYLERGQEEEEGVRWEYILKMKDAEKRKVKRRGRNIVWLYGIYDQAPHLNRDSDSNHTLIDLTIHKYKTQNTQDDCLWKS